MPKQSLLANPRKIKEITTFDFPIDQPGIYSISTVAHCSSSKQTQFSEDETLHLQIDELVFSDASSEKNSPSAWNGTQLRGDAKTVVFLLILEKGDHTLTFFPENGAQIDKIEVENVSNPRNIQFSFENQVQKNNEEWPLCTFQLLKLPLISVAADVSVWWHWMDGDRVKLTIDGQTEWNDTNSSTKYINWAWTATPWQLFSGEKRKKKTFVRNSIAALHTIEFWVDDTPVVHDVTLDLGDILPSPPAPTPLPGHRIPTVGDPKWTGNFADDTDQMLLARLIFGEARNQSKEVMQGVAWTVKNRLLAKHSYFGFTYHEIILKKSRGIYQFSCMNPNDPNNNDNFSLLINPLGDKKKLTERAWFSACEVAADLLNEVYDDPTDGATYFHSDNISAKKFVTKDVPGAIFVKRIGHFLFYQGPQKRKL